METDGMVETTLPLAERENTTLLEPIVTGNSSKLFHGKTRERQERLLDIADQSRQRDFLASGLAAAPPRSSSAPHDHVEVLDHSRSGHRRLRRQNPPSLASQFSRTYS